MNARTQQRAVERIVGLLRAQIVAATEANLAEAARIEKALGLDGPPDDAGAIRKDMGAWRSNARNRVRKGQSPRRFTSSVIPAATSDAVWEVLRTARSRSDVDAAFSRAEKASSAEVAWAGHNYDLALAAFYASKVAAASRQTYGGLRAAITTAAAKVAKAGAEPAAVANAGAEAARAAVQAGVTVAPDDLLAVIRDIYGDSWIAGAHAATVEQGGGASVVGSLSGLDAEIDWDSWAPGWAAAAVKDADGGLAELLDTAAVTVKGITGTALDRLGNLIAEGLAAGDSTDDIAASLDELIADPARAEMIAQTETARAMSAASLDTYKANGVDLLDWLTAAGACPSCDDNAAQGPYAPDDFPDLPGHPKCRCAAVPHLSS
ncbi:MAG: phage minor head protein [Burkholderiales bacterium]